MFKASQLVVTSLQKCTKTADLITIAQGDKTTKRMFSNTFLYWNIYFFQNNKMIFNFKTFNKFMRNHLHLNQNIIIFCVTCVFWICVNYVEWFSRILRCFGTLYLVRSALDSLHIPATLRILGALDIAGTA